MCDVFKPVFESEQFGYAMAIRAPYFSDEEPFVYRLFGQRLENTAVAAQIDQLQENIRVALELARRQELKSINEFDIDWANSKDFLSGYSRGMQDMSEALSDLRARVGAALAAESQLDLFEEIVIPWAENWQDQNNSFDFSALEPVLLDEFFENRVVILSQNHAILIPAEGPSQGHWFQLPGYEANAGSSLVQAMYNVTALGDGEGLSFQFGDALSEPLNSERSYCTYEFSELCEEHWAEAKQANEQALSERGLLSISPEIQEIAEALNLRPEVFAKHFGDAWFIQRGEFGGDLFLRPSRDDVISTPIQDVHELSPAAGFLVDPIEGNIQVGAVDGQWHGHSLHYGLAEVQQFNLFEPNLIGALEEALWQGQLKHDQSKKRCPLCGENTPTYNLSEEGHCYSCGSEKLGIVY